MKRLIQSLWMLVLSLLLVDQGYAQNDLVITGVLDAPLYGGVPKMVELYVMNDIADLSTFNVAHHNNGSVGVTGSTTLAGSASAGEFIYVVHSTTDQTELNTWFGAGVLTIVGAIGGSGQVISGAMNINGNDAVILRYDATGAFAGAETIADAFGIVGVDGTGEAWEYLDGWAYRKPGTGPDGNIFHLANWNFSGIDALDGEATNAGAATPFTISSYVPPAAVVPVSPWVAVGAFILIGGVAYWRKRG